MAGPPWENSPLGPLHTFSLDNRGLGHQWAPRVLEPAQTFQSLGAFAVLAVLECLSLSLPAIGSQLKCHLLTTYSLLISPQNPSNLSLSD